MIVLVTAYLEMCVLQKSLRWSVERENIRDDVNTFKMHSHAI